MDEAGQLSWADPDGGTGGTCPLQTNGRQKWSDRVSFVSLASQIPKCTKTCMKSHKIAYVGLMPKIISGWGSAPIPRWGELMTLPKPLVDWGGGKSLPQTSPPQRFRRLASSSSATHIQCAPSKTIFWIRPCQL